MFNAFVWHPPPFWESSINEKREDRLQKAKLFFDPMSSQQITASFYLFRCVFRNPLLFHLDSFRHLLTLISLCLCLSLSLSFSAINIAYVTLGRVFRSLAVSRACDQCGDVRAVRL